MNLKKIILELEPLIKALLRAYEGIFDHPSFISEIMIAHY